MKRLRGNLGADPRVEDVVVNHRDVVVFGPGLPGGYLYFTHAWGTQPEVLSARLLQLDGRKGHELLLEHAEWEVPGEVRVEVVEIYRIHDGYLKRAFAQRTAEVFRGLGAVARSTCAVLPGRGARRLRVSVAKVKGLNPGNYRAADPGGAFPLLLPWDTNRPRVFVLSGDGWTPKGDR